MTSAAVQMEMNSNYDGYVDGVAYYPVTNSNFYESNNSNNHIHQVGHPPMLHYSHAPPNPPPLMRQYYPRQDLYPAAQYERYSASPAPPPPPPHHQHYLQVPQQMYYGSWPGAGASPAISQAQVHYPFYPILPPDAQNQQRRPTSKKDKNKYGQLELNVFEVENEDLASALNYVNRNPKATLFDVDGIIPDIAKADEGASRFIQKRLKLGNNEERQLGLTTALASLDELVVDQYGNFMLQGLFEFGTAEMKKELMDAIYGQDVVSLCLHMHGCRVIQKAIRCLEQEEVCKLITEFQDKVLTFIHDPNGNHVIQRCIQVMNSFAKNAESSGDPDLASSLSDQMQFIIDDIVANVETLSTHRYGCRVVQRAIEHCVDKQKNDVLESMIACHEKLVVDQYGNYVVQQVLACGSEVHKAEILKTLTTNGALLAMSKHKYASNVVESVLTHGETHHKEKILEEMLKDTRGEVGGYCCIIELSKDPIANYVVNKAIEVCENEQKAMIFEVISSSRQELSKSPYAKYVLQRIAKRDK
eukprot:CAMPEP_0183722464 /NCGR_PEP_ID=MMETSP0737-20130205/14406_1 /TAXON_ID=385413 /ORGANISM="Thalassiosira miniscula, Strain CCMP1093" /LENGTH=529 /DNA_ID=CAMNT_0025952623 /DNA_START=116 /DNA_END=1705 /DNA_ORIENTATION=+